MLYMNIHVSRPLRGHGIGGSDDGDQVCMRTEVLTVGSRVLLLPVVHHF